MLYEPGHSGYYWSSSSGDKDTGLTLRMFSGFVSDGRSARSAGYPLRCIREPDEE
ncbi:MAG: hypothetical protein LBS46_03230 [Dysgonamonadaceae bacterium]|nr:hypothetical protein [Dysgonamonadaceae bacterium]